MFHDPDEKFKLELEVEGVVICSKEITVPFYDITKQMFKRKAEREYPKKEWAIFVVKRRFQNTGYRKKKNISNDAVII